MSRLSARLTMPDKACFAIISSCYASLDLLTYTRDTGWSNSSEQLLLYGTKSRETNRPRLIVADYRADWCNIWSLYRRSVAHRPQRADAFTTTTSGCVRCASCVEQSATVVSTVVRRYSLQLPQR